MRFLSLFVFFFLCTTLYAQSQVENLSRLELPYEDDPSETLRAILSVDESAVDLIWSKVTIDELVQSEIDGEEIELVIRTLADLALTMAGTNADDQSKLDALRALLYEPGPWNSQQPFSYDFDNPNGRLAKNKTLHEYLRTGKGNCVSMPILFLLVGEQMGLELNITTAPRHVFVQFYDRDRAELVHLEPTSGALPQRISWQRKVLPMTDRSIESGMYMKRLGKREQVSVMAETLLQALREQEDYSEMLEVAELMNEAYPQNDVAHLNAADASLRLIQSEILPFYQSPNDMPPEVLEKFERWAAIHDEALAQLEQLGWRPAQATPETYIPD